MKDWADEIELTIANAYSSHGAILAADGDGMIAKALRKARADGMRWAANLVTTDRCDGDVHYAKRVFIELADGIEKGQ
jgi:hypothetical protein